MEESIHIFDLRANVDVELSEMEQTRSLLLRERVAEETKPIDRTCEKSS